MHRPFHVALTGNIASGKSTVAAMLREYGATIIDADVLARRAIEPGSSGFDKVVERFGTSMLQPDGSIDRAALRRRVFDNAVERDALNSIVHPVVGRLREEALDAASKRGDRIVVSDIPLLFEVGLHHAFDAIVLVDAPEAVRLRRLVDNRQLSEADARSMIAAQLPSAEKRLQSTWVIDNDGSPDQLARRVAQVWNELADRARLS